MKTAIVFLLLCLSPCVIYSQSDNPWVGQVSGFPAAYTVLSLHAVDSNTVWAVSQTNTGSGYAKTFTRTTDGGTTWITGSINNTSGGTNFSSVYAFDGNRAWVTMYDQQMITSGGIFGTTDGGTTWTKNPNTFTAPSGFADFIHFFDANNGVSVGDPNNGYFEIYTTSNAGATWSRVPQANIPAPLATGESAAIVLPAAAGNSLWFPTFPAGTGRIFRTTDKGLTWSLVMYPGTSANRIPAFAFQDENIGIGNGDYGDVRKTTDGGSTWTVIPTSLKLGAQVLKAVPHTPGMYTASAFLHYNSLAQHYLYGTFYTVDAGAHWTMATASTDSSTPDLVFTSPTLGWRGDISPNIFKWTVPQGRYIGVHPDSFVFSTLDVGLRSDTVAVDLMNYGSESVTVSNIVMPGAGFTVTHQPTLPLTISSLGSVRVELCSSPGAAGKYRDSLVFVTNASNAARSRVYLEGSGAVFRKAENGKMYGASSSLYSVDPTTGTSTTIGSIGSIQFNGLTINPQTGILHGSVAGSNSTLVYHVDCASALTAVARTFPVGNMRAIAFNVQNGELYGATTAGRLYRLNLDTGDTVGIGTAPGVAYGSIAFSPSGKLWASVNSGTSGKDRIYTVNTATGVATLVGSTGDNGYTPAIFISPTGALYGLKTVGVLHPSSNVISIDTLTGVGSALFSTGLSGITSMTMASFAITAVEPTEAPPKEFALLQNYPNPFNPSTTIEFELPKSSAVRLSVFDILGREVSVLVNERRNAGVHEIKFDGSNLASGVYVYRLTAGAFVQSKKLMILK